MADETPVPGESLEDYILRTEALAAEIDRRVKSLQAEREANVLRLEDDARERIQAKIRLVSERLHPFPVSQEWIDKQSDPESEIMIELAQAIEALDRHYDIEIRKVVDDVSASTCR